MYLNWNPSRLEISLFAVLYDFKHSRWISLRYADGELSNQL